MTDDSNNKTVSRDEDKHWLRTSILFFLGWVFMYADRTILSPVQHLIGEEFALSNAEIGLISSLFFAVYAAAQIPSGMMGDKYGRTKIIFGGFLVFGLCTGLTGVVSTFGMLLLCRAVAGLGEGTYYGCQYAISADSTPLKYRTFAYAIVNSGQAFGITLGLVGSSYLCYELGWGWRSAFIIYAIPTIICGILILLFVKHGIEPQSKLMNVKSSGKDNLIQILKNRTLMSIFFVEFCAVYAFFVMVTWLPQYLVESRSMDISEASNYASAVAWTSIPAALFIGWLSDKLKTRKPLLLTVLPLSMMSVLGLLFAPSIELVIASIFCYGIVGKLTSDPLILALISDNAPKSMMSTVYGAYNFIAMLGAIFAPYLTGWLKDVSNSFDSGLYLALILLAIGWIVGAFGIKTKRPA